MALDFIYDLRDEEQYFGFVGNSLAKRLEKSADERESEDNRETKKLIRDMLEGRLSSEEEKIMNIMFYLKHHYHFNPGSATSGYR
jgi:hypothetical protein